METGMQHQDHIQHYNIVIVHDHQGQQTVDNGSTVETVCR
jgi:hypothetical protein